MCKKGEERDNSPSKHTCCGLSVLASLRWELMAKLSPCAEISPFPSWHRKYVTEKYIRCSKRNTRRKVKDIKSNLQNKHAAVH
jgi:hypothetical protein